MNYSVADCAKEIRKVLKKEFPEIKFSVRSSTFAGGDSVDVGYTNGSTSSSTVKEKISQFKYGHFNGMEDIYENSNRNENIPQTKFLTVERRLSEDFVEGLWVMALMHFDNYNQKNLDDLNKLGKYVNKYGCWESKSTLVYQYLNSIGK